MDVDGSRALHVRITPHVLEKSLSREHTTRGLEERLEESELLCRELHESPVPPNLVTLSVQSEMAEGQSLGALLSFEAPPDSPHTGEEFLRAERLHDIVVRPHLETDDP